MRKENNIFEAFSKLGNRGNRGNRSMIVLRHSFQSINGAVKLSFFLYLCCIISQSQAQSYFTNGTAKSSGGQCYQLTAASNGQNGSVWYADKLDLTKNFDLEFKLNFGNRDQGADGIVFVLQTVGTNALGSPGGGLGYQGFSPSLGVEFDDYQNTSEGDLSNDHIGILKNGDVSHKGQNSLAGPVNANASGANIEDGKDHLVRITWHEPTKTIRVWFDCSLRLTKSYDIVRDIFKGQNMVYWGFTSATGGERNTQIACLSDDIIVPDSLHICEGEDAQLNARESSDNVYTWSPTTALNSSTKRNPTSSAKTNTLYTVTYNDKCGNKTLDTIHVFVTSVPAAFTLGKDTTVCKGEIVPLEIKGAYDKIEWDNGSRSSTRTVANKGTYWVKAWNGSKCYSSDSIKIETLIAPRININGDETFCTGDSLLLVIQAQPDGQTFIWDDGLTSANRYVNATQSNTVTAQNMCGIAFDEISVKELTIESFNLGSDTVLCQGDTIFKQVKINGPYTYLWSTGETGKALYFTEPGKYWFTASREQCSLKDSIDVKGLTKPIFDLPEDFLLCDKEEYVLNSGVDNAEVIWNGTHNAKSFTLNQYDGTLKVNAKNQCGSDSAQIEVELKECACDLFFPNAVSPNYDGLNESFGPVSNCDKLIDYSIEIYNRWGQKVFESRDITQKWDMRFQNELVSSGTYLYMARYTGMIDGFHMKQYVTGRLLVIK